jgi:FkbM family methyltransferase
MVKKMMKRLISKPFGRQGAQWFFERLRRAALIGLNIGRGGRVEDSGEGFVLKYVKFRLYRTRPQTWKYDKEAPQNFWSERTTIAERQGASENENYEAKPTQPDSKCVAEFGIGPNPLRFFDVGANVGDWGAQVLGHFDPHKIEVFAFEPSRAAFKELGIRFKQFPHFQLFNFGLGHKNMETFLFSDSQASGIASLYRRRLDHFGIHFDQKNDEMVQIQTLDAFCKERKISRIDFLKLDVEGHELRVLEGAKNLLESNAIQFIQFEFGGSNIDSRTYFQDFFYLLNEKYRIFRVLKNGLHPIPEYREVDECFVTTNYLAEHR